MRARYLIYLLFLIIGVSCKKDRPDKTESLPPATTVGANTFGCLIDGKVFVPNKNPLSTSIILQCNYEYVNSHYYFILRGANYIDDYTVFLNVDQLYLTGDTTLSFSSPSIGPAYGRVRFPNSTVNDIHETNGILPGNITFTKFDLLNQIASGIFWFDAIDSASGKIVQIREGRFDVQFTQ